MRMDSLHYSQFRQFLWSYARRTYGPKRPQT